LQAKDGSALSLGEERSNFDEIEQLIQDICCDGVSIALCVNDRRLTRLGCIADNYD
jgi:hypothetical protein